MSPQTVTGALTGWTFASRVSVSRALLHRCWTSLSDNGVPWVSFARYCSKSAWLDGAFNGAEVVDEREDRIGEVAALALAAVMFMFTILLRASWRMRLETGNSI